MKKGKTVKLILMILICVLVILVGFVGIYVKDSNFYHNILPEYSLAPDLKGATILEFEVDDSSETIYYDKEGKKVDSSTVTDENKKDYTTEEKPINEKEALTTENYKEVVKIMQERLNFLQTDQYRLDLDEKTGKIVLTFEDNYPDDIHSILPMEGSLKLIDSTTEEVIIDNTNFQSAEASYASTETGYTAYIHLKLNESGLQKINDIDKYKVIPSVDENAENTENDENTEDTENTEETTNKLKVMFDDDEIAEITYDDILLTGKTLRLTTDSDLTSNSTIQSKLNTNTIVAKLATIGKSPVIYNITAEEYIQSNVASDIPYIVIIIAVIACIIALYFIIRYRWNGLLAMLAFAAITALFLIIIRLTKIEISLNGFAGFLILIVLNTILVQNILSVIQNKERVFSENVKKAYLKSMDVFAITLIIFVVLAFSAMTVINSMGLLIFWGWLVILLGNLILTVPMLSMAYKKN